MSYLLLGQLKKNLVKLNESHWLLNLYFYQLFDKEFFISSLLILNFFFYFKFICFNWSYLLYNIVLVWGSECRYTCTPATDSCLWQKFVSSKYNVIFLMIGLHNHCYHTGGIQTKQP